MIECGKLLQRAGYRIKVLNTINFKNLCTTTPLCISAARKIILKLVNTVDSEYQRRGRKKCGGFWVKAERLLYCALVGYIWYEAPAEEMNFITLLELITASEAARTTRNIKAPSICCLPTWKNATPTISR